MGVNTLARHLILMSILVTIGCIKYEHQSTIAAESQKPIVDERISAIEIISYEGDAIKDLRKIVKNQSTPSEYQENVSFKAIGIPDLVNMNPENPDGIGWPPLPRRMLNLDQTSKWDRPYTSVLKALFLTLSKLQLAAIFP